MGEPNEVLRISTEDLKQGAPTFATQSEELGKAAARLADSLDALGLAWGGDEEGARFAESYSPHRDRIEGAVDTLVTGLASIHSAMHDMADGHIGNEENVKGLFVPEDSGRRGPGTSPVTGSGGHVNGPPDPSRSSGGPGLHQN